MKLCKLKLKNLNSFRDEIELDFEKSPLDEASLVAITGPTGAGKTTLLDAICVALYGKTPRLAGTGTQNPSHLISHGETEGHAEVHFLARETRYLAEWTLRRGSSPRGQLRVAENEDLITDRLSSQGKSLGSSENTISDEVTAILGLDFNAFKRSVMLAQGEFAAFLKAKDEERRIILEATAGVDIYDKLKDALNHKVGELEDTHQEVLQQLNSIPAATPEDLTESENRLRELQRDADALNTRRQEIQAEKQREKDRAKSFSELHTAQERSRELLSEQMDITALEAELEQANRANHLRPEKQAYNIAESELDNAEEALRQAEMEFADATTQFDANQTDFDEKDKVYLTALVQSNQKADDYNAARLDVRQATDRFARASELEEDLLEATTRIEGFSTELAENNERYGTWEAQVGIIDTFLADNQLPPDRQERLTSANTLFAEHRVNQNQLTERLEAETVSTSTVSRLSTAVEQLDREREERAAQQEEAAASSAEAANTLAALQERGTLEEWRTRRRYTEQAMPIALRYETIQSQLVQAENELQEFRGTAVTLNSQLERITVQLAIQSQACQDADEAVTRLEAEREAALLANHIGHLRQHLHTGEPCPVCGATEHPRGDNVEPEETERLDTAENALANAKQVVERAQRRRETLEGERIRTNQEKVQADTQAKEVAEKRDNLKSEIQSTRAQWQEIYPSVAVSSEWINQQIREADAAVAELQSAHESHRQASQYHQEGTQQLDNLEQNIVREISALETAKQASGEVRNAVEALSVEVADIEARCRRLLPDSFHGIGLEDAVNRFADIVTVVAAHERERDQIQNEITHLNVGIREKQRSLETERERHGKLDTDIKGYRDEGSRFLEAAREKSGGLTTLSEIDVAMGKLDQLLQTRSVERDEAEGRLRESETVVTEARTNRLNCQSRRAECSQKFEATKNKYLEGLNQAGFDSPEAHDSAFREETWIEQTAGKIASYTEEKQQLEVDIARLGAIFEVNPFDPEVLTSIEISENEINNEIEGKQQEIGAQQIKIDTLEDALDRRRAIDAEMQESGHELTRWKALQDTIPANSLRDFALDIMFKQMGSLANSQLKYLTSERYQLKVEGIGKLTVVDRWNANEERPVETLSGGESFLTSLALALALSELSRGRSQIHSLFLDEGFGTLDSETLDVAIAALEGLQMQGRSIFLISHVGELTRRIPVRIAVDRVGNGSSRVQVRGR